MNRIKYFWKGISIKGKLLVFLIAMLLAVGLFNLYLNNNNYKIVDQFNETMNNYYLINDLLKTTEDNQVILERYLRELNPQGKVDYAQTKLEMIDLEEALRKRFPSKESYFALSAIKNSMEVYHEIWDSAIYERENQIESYYVFYYDGLNIETYTIGYIEELLYISLSEGTELYNELVKEASIMRRISVVLIFGISVIAVLIGILVANSLVNPIKKLATASIKIASGDLDVGEILVNSRDEVGVLADSFNTMSRNIKQYVHDLEQKVIIEKKLHHEELEVLRMAQLLKEAQFQALQTQINPHFLFNTLNTISRTALLEDSETTINLIQAMSDMFRYKLRTDKEMIPLKEELEIISAYIFLQKYRFKERLEFDLYIDKQSETVLIPIFSLQPLVENAIIHGIEPNAEGGHLTIKVKTDNVNKERWTIIEIIDTGVGMSKKRLEEVLKFEGLNNKSIGVINVYQRLKMIYTDSACFEIDSEKNLGTTVLLKFKS